MHPPVHYPSIHIYVQTYMFYIHVCFTVSVFMCLTVCLYLSVCFCPSVRLSLIVCQSVFFYLYDLLSPCLFLFLFVCLSLIDCPFAHQPACLFVCLPVCPLNFWADFSIIPKITFTPTHFEWMNYLLLIRFCGGHSLKLTWFVSSSITILFYLTRCGEWWYNYPSLQQMSKSACKWAQGPWHNNQKFLSGFYTDPDNKTFGTLRQSSQKPNVMSLPLWGAEPHLALDPAFSSVLVKHS